MAQVPGLGLDQSQLADVINQQYKGYSQKQRNQMMQSAAATPDNWGAITQQANKTATQPTEFLGAGRTDNIPTVSKDGVQWTGYDDAGLQRLYGMNQNYNPVTSRWTEQVKNPNYVAPDPYAVTQNQYDPNNMWAYGSTYSSQSEPEYLQVQREQRTPVSTDYTDSVGKKYYSPETINKIESSAPNFLSGWFGAYSNPSGNYYDPRGVSAGGYYFADPWGFSHSLSKVGNNKYFVSENTLNENTRSGTADTWFSLNPNADLSGLQYGQFQGQNGLFFDPTKTNLSSLLTPGRNNSAYAEKKSGGFLGGLNNLAEGIAKWTDPVFYKSMGGGTDSSLWKDLTNEGLYGAVFNKLDPILDKIDPGHNWTQDQITGAIGADSQKEAFNQIAPLVLAAVTYGVGSGGAAAGSAAGGATTGSMAGSIMQGVQALNSLNSGDFAGAALSGLGAANVNPASAFTGKLTDLGMSPDVAKMVGNFGVSAASNLMRGQDMNSALASSLFSTASGKAGSEIGKALSPTLGEIGSRAIGGAASGGLNSLFNKNNVVAGSLFGGMSGGLHGFLNSTDRQNKTFSKEQNIKNQQQAQNLTKLARMFVKK